MTTCHHHAITYTSQPLQPTTSYRDLPIGVAGCCETELRFGTPDQEHILIMFPTLQQHCLHARLSATLTSR